MQMSLAEFKDYMDQLKYWRGKAAGSAKEARELRKEYAKQLETVEKELAETKIQCLYWRELALENQNG